MPTHDWKDQTFDWKSLHEAELYITSFCRKYARLGGQSKEKFGQLRFYAKFGLSLHSLFYPGYHYNQFPKWLWTLDIYVLTPTLQFIFGKVFHKWQSYIYGLAYRRAIQKWPHIWDEIVAAADYPEYIKCENVQYTNQKRL